MNRKCLIIGYPGEQGQKGFCSGVAIDLNNYSNYFKSSLGGAWEDDEITVKIGPSKDFVFNYLSKIRTDDYLLFVFCGHGHYDEIKNQTIIQINKSDELEEDKISSCYANKLAIFDCCRRTIASMRRDESALMEVFSKSQIELNRAECRKYYDKRIEDCNGQITKSYACSIDEYSGDDSQLGGFFSHSLIKTAKNRLKQASV